jgi:hypothetical protein
MGTPSLDGPSGTFYDITENPEYKQHRFSYKDNDRVPSFADAEALIDEDLRAQNCTRESAYFLREYLARFAVEMSERLYKFTEANTYETARRASDEIGPSVRRAEDLEVDELTQKRGVELEAVRARHLGPNGGGRPAIERGQRRYERRRHIDRIERAVASESGLPVVHPDDLKRLERQARRQLLIVEPAQQTLHR